MCKNKNKTILFLKVSGMIILLQAVMSSLLLSGYQHIVDGSASLQTPTPKYIKTQIFIFQSLHELGFQIQIVAV